MWREGPVCFGCLQQRFHTIPRNDFSVHVGQGDFENYCREEKVSSLAKVKLVERQAGRYLQMRDPSAYHHH